MFVFVFSLTICKNEVVDSDLGASSPVLQRALYDVCWHVLRGTLSKDQAVAAFLDIAVSLLFTLKLIRLCQWIFIMNICYFNWIGLYVMYVIEI